MVDYAIPDDTLQERIDLITDLRRVHPMVSAVEEQAIHTHLFTPKTKISMTCPTCRRRSRKQKEESKKSQSTLAVTPHKVARDGKRRKVEPSGATFDQPKIYPFSPESGSIEPPYHRPASVEKDQCTCLDEDGLKRVIGKAVMDMFFVHYALVSIDEDGKMVNVDCKERKYRVYMKENVHYPERRKFAFLEYSSSGGPASSRTHFPCLMQMPSHRADYIPKTLEIARNYYIFRRNLELRFEHQERSSSKVYLTTRPGTMRVDYIGAALNEGRTMGVDQDLDNMDKYGGYRSSHGSGKRLTGLPDWAEALNITGMERIDMFGKFQDASHPSVHSYLAAYLALTHLLCLNDTRFGGVAGGLFSMPLGGDEHRQVPVRTADSQFSSHKSSDGILADLQSEAQSSTVRKELQYIGKRVVDTLNSDNLCGWTITADFQGVERFAEHAAHMANALSFYETHHTGKLAEGQSKINLKEKV